MLPNDSDSIQYEDNESNEENGSEYAAADVHGIPLLLVAPTRHWTIRTNQWFVRCRTQFGVDSTYIRRSDLIFALREFVVATRNGSALLN